jgi:hypothetical protein
VKRKRLSPGLMAVPLSPATGAVRNIIPKRATTHPGGARALGPGQSSRRAESEGLVECFKKTSNPVRMVPNGRLMREARDTLKIAESLIVVTKAGESGG